MNQAEADQAIQMTKGIKADIRNLLQKHASLAAQLHSNDADPHTPIIGLTQMALAQASVEFLILAGCTPPDAVNFTLNVTQQAMQKWLDALQNPKKETK